MFGFISKIRLRLELELKKNLIESSPDKIWKKFSKGKIKENKLQNKFSRLRGRVNMLNDIIKLLKRREVKW